MFYSNWIYLTERVNKMWFGFSGVGSISPLFSKLPLVINDSSISNNSSLEILTGSSWSSTRKSQIPFSILNHWIVTGNWGVSIHAITVPPERDIV